MPAVDYAIDIVELDKRFKRQTLSKGGYTTLKSSLLGKLKQLRKGSAEGHYTEAIKALTLRVPQGASVGIIGQNGSGKSTLLKLITGIYKPDHGSIAVNGRIAALIELGAGFHPDFTGRENVYLGGVMHGLTRAQIDERFPEIVRFAELEEVIDDPVRTYSSGMFMRLGFSLAVHTDPQILIIDEVLAVGDAAFVAKCKEKLSRLRAEGKTLLLVSHDLGAVERWCDEVLWLHAGRVKDRGNPRRVIDHYREFVEHGEEQVLRQALDARHEQRVQSANAGKNPEPDHAGAAPAAAEAKSQRWGSREIEIESVQLKDSKGQAKLLFHTEDALCIEIRYRLNEATLADNRDLVFGICLRRTDGLVLHGTNTDLERIEVPAPALYGVVRYETRRLGLLDGNYELDVAVHKKDGYAYDYCQSALTFGVHSSGGPMGVFEPEHTWSFEGRTA